MKNKKNIQIVLGVAFALLIIGLYIYNLQKDLPGADDNASSVIGQVAPHYKPWASHVGPELSKMTERVMFGLQMLGGVILFTVCYKLLRKSAKQVSGK